MIRLKPLVFALLASLAAGLLSGFAPALHAGRDSFISGLRERAGIEVLTVSEHDILDGIALSIAK